MPSGRLCGSQAAAAISASDTARSVPAIAKTPSARSMSASAASSRCAAIAFAFATIFSVARWTAEPPIAAARAAALAEPALLGVALDVMHLVGMQAEPVADQLLVDRLVPHPLGDRAG